MGDDDNNSIVRLHLGIPMDPSGYLRHECPHCMLEFKIAGDEASFTDALDWWSSRAVAEAGLRPDVDAPAALSTTLRCPYCATAASAEEFVHTDLRTFLSRVALREIIEPLVFDVVDRMTQSFKRVRSKFIKVEVKQGSDARSPRPLAGPEPDDMLRVRCGQCDERFKLLEGWSARVVCPGCGSWLELS